MRGRLPRQRHPHGERTAFGGDDRALERVADARQNRLLIVDAADVDALVRPARGVERERLDGDHAAVFDGDAHRALGAGLARAAALEVAGIDDPGVAARRSRAAWIWPSAQ